MKLNHELDWVEKQTIGFGMTIYILWNRLFDVPLGFVWGWSHGISFDTLGSYVLPELRRQGIRTRINHEIFLTHSMIKTWQGTKTGGLAFMKAQGYKFQRETAMWYKSRKRR